MRFIHLGMVLMPIVFLISSVMFYALQADIYAAACFIMAFLFAVVVISEALKTE